MVVDEGRLPPGIVFRRLGTAAERTQAGRFRTGRSYRSPRLTGDEEWSGLWSLTDADALWAVAATVRLSAIVLEVRALAAPAALWDRLLRELADAGRAHGAEWLVAATDRGAEDLLRDNGFGAAPDLGLPPLCWLAREV